MTTNKPEVVAWGVPNSRLTERQPFMQLLHTQEGTQYPELLDPLIRLSDYEALQAELKKAVAALTDGRFTRCDGPAGWRPPLGNPAGTLIDRIDSMEDECDQLRKEVESLKGYNARRGLNDWRHYTID